MAGAPPDDGRTMDGLDSTLAFKLGSWEARLSSIEESLKKSCEADQRLENKLENLVDKFTQAIKDLDNRYAPKEGCLREKSVTRREVAVMATTIAIAIDLFGLVLAGLAIYFH